MRVWCLFEQSGTFKNEFIKLGFNAYDADLLNAFNQTDFQIDLFKEIENAKNDNASFFDKIEKDDLVFAFFPCTRFQTQTPLLSRGESYSQRNWGDEKKLDYSLKIVSEMLNNYTLFIYLFQIAIKRGFKLIVENPYQKPNFLREYFPIKPKVVILNRANYGDFYRKPTQFFFVNCEPQNNFIFESNSKKIELSINKVKGSAEADRKTRRSMIAPEFANRFIREFVLPI